METIVKRCSRCVLPLNYPGITIDAAGICNYCRETDKTDLIGEDKLLEIIDRFRGTAGKYDCMVAFSGGRDSSYLLWYAVRKLGLRTLACMVDNGFVPEQTRTNVKIATDILGVDLVVKHHHMVKDCARHTLKSWMKRPTPGMIGMLCAGCTLGLRLKLNETAKENNIPMMLYGAGEPERSFAEKYLSCDPHGAITKRTLIFGFISEILHNPAYLLNPSSIATYAKEFLFRWSPFFQRQVLRKVKPHDLVVVAPFFFIRWEESRILSVIRDELQWGECSYTNNTWRSDCMIAIFKNHLYNETVGFSKVEELLSNLVRINQIARQEALDRLARERDISDEFVVEFSELLGFEVGDLTSALNMARDKGLYDRVGRAVWS